MEEEEKYDPYKAVEGMLSDRPDYQIPDEVSKLIDTYKSGAEELRGYGQQIGELQGLGQQYADIFKQRAGRTDMPGADIMRERALSDTGAYLSALERGSFTPSSIGNVFRNQSRIMQDIEMQNAMYRDRAETDYAGALLGQGQYESGLLGQQASLGAQAIGLEGQGLSAAAQYKDKAFQLNELDPYYDALNLATTKAGNEYSGMLAEEMFEREMESRKELAEEERLYNIEQQRASTKWHQFGQRRRLDELSGEKQSFGENFGESMLAGLALGPVGGAFYNIFKNR